MFDNLVINIQNMWFIFSQSIAFDLHNPIRWSFILCHLHRRSNKNPKCCVGMSRLLNMSATLLNKSFNKLWVVQRFKRHTCMLNKNIYIHLVWSSLFLKKIDCNSQLYKNWLEWNLHNSDSVITSILIG